MFFLGKSNYLFLMFRNLRFEHDMFFLQIGIPVKKNENKHNIILTVIKKMISWYVQNFFVQKETHWENNLMRQHLKPYDFWWNNFLKNIFQKYNAKCTSESIRWFHHKRYRKCFFFKRYRKCFFLKMFVLENVFWNLNL